MPKGVDRIEVRDGLVRGLYLRLTSSGERTWSLAYRTRAGVKRRLTLGPYRSPTMASDGLTVGQARDRARDRKADIRLGGDPVADLRAAREEARRPKGLTVADLVDQMIAALDLAPTTRHSWEGMAKHNVHSAPEGRRLASEIKRREIRDWLRRIARRAPGTANHLLGILSRAYTWGMDEELVDASPMARMRRPAPKRAGTRVLSLEEARAVWAACADVEWWHPRNGGGRPRADGTPARASGFQGPPWPPPPRRVAADAVRLLLLTCVRRGAVLGARVGEFQGLDGAAPRWVVPPERSKRKRSSETPLPHVVPLSPAALEVVRRRIALAEGGLLFPTVRSGRRLARGKGAAAWTTKFVEQLRAAAERRLGAGEWEPWTVHGIRRAVATLMREELKVPREVVSMLLGHTPPGAVATAIYDRAELLHERRAALEAWADLLVGQSPDRHTEPAAALARA